MKPGKVLCCVFFLAVIGGDPAQNLCGGSMEGGGGGVLNV